MTILDDIVLEETRWTILQLVKMETILALYSSLPASLNAYILDACGTTIHRSRMKTNGTLLTEG